MTKIKRPFLFFVYSDQDLPWLEKIKAMMSPQIRGRRFDVWDKTQIPAGTKRDDEIASAISKASMALILLSPHLLASEAILQNELQPLLKKAAQAALVVLWVPIKACLFQECPLCEFQAAWPPEKPLESLPGRKVNEALLSIAEKVGTLIQQNKMKNSNHVNPYNPQSDLDNQLEEAHAKLEELIVAAEDTSICKERILEIKRKLRERTQLKNGYVLSERYRLIEVIGHGGFGKVWKGYDRIEKCFVAIKILHDQFSFDKTKRTRFFRGAREMAKINHESIVRIIESQCEHDGHYFFTMELIECGSFSANVKAGRLNIETCINIIIEIGKILAQVHDKNLIHRDIKPENILLGDNGKPKLTDFDLVKCINTTGGTRTGMMGTVVYAAPELMSNAKDVGPPCDIFGLGMVSVFACFGNDLPLDTLKDPEAFINRLPISKPLKKVMTKATRWDIKQRYSTVDEFCIDLQHALQLIQSDGHFENYHDTNEKVQNITSARQEIAIIGISGRYPMAPDLDTFWINIMNGRDCIEEIPIERYNGSINILDGIPKWGGFIKGIDIFDSQFFHMSPRETELTDPRELIILELSWLALENAGYHPFSLREENWGPVGVFIGTGSAYQPLPAIDNLIPHYSGTIANRVSYYMGFNGPSVAVDNDISSLTAIHQACQSIQQGECGSAIVGAVHLELHWAERIAYKNYKMLSPDGKCKPFSANADGIVPGEGCGVMLLTSLHHAANYNCNILGIIKSSVLGHGGNTNGFTVPNIFAQESIILKAIQLAAIEPKSISYIEAHGSGTSLGDPIEMAGLERSLGERLGNRPCAIGSVKSNIGHLRAAAGMAGLTKILLQFRFKKLVPTINANETSPYIDFDKIPFRLQKEISDWIAPVIDENVYPLRAGLSGQGLGGSFAHIILEEPPDQPSSQKIGQGIFILSARNENTLKAYAKSFLFFLTNEGKKISFPDLIFTLQTGRMGMKSRFATVVSNLTEVASELDFFIKNQESKYFFYQSSVDKSTHSLSGAADDLPNDLFKIAQNWSQGTDIDWIKIFGRKRKIPLPTYPFHSDGKRIRERLRPSSL